MILGFASSADLAVDAFDEVDAAAEEFPAPAFVADAVGPEVGAGEGGVWLGGVADEAVRGVRVHAEEEGNEEVMRVPEGFEGLLPDFVVGGGVHEKHAEEHHVARHTSCLSVVYLNGSLWAELSSLDIEEVDVVS